MAKIRVGRSSGHDEAVVCDRTSVDEHRACIGVYVLRRAEQHGDVPLRPQHVTQRCGNRRRRKPGRGDLIQEWLEQVVIVAIHEHHVGSRVIECSDGPKAAEAAAEDDHARSLRWLRGADEAG